MPPRLVLNHSTFIPDLLQLLRKICQRSNTITTIIPGKISNTKSRLEGPLLLRLTTSTQSQYGITVKALARSKSSIQEVFFAAKGNNINREILKNHLSEILSQERCVVELQKEKKIE
mmetsp:Transcript_25324/g.27662  ORF Transcript_25324/g.27662 Transcript_25324/m.27662 type:complete len:117 (-) Transcript_25324:1871-2221(-)